MMKETTLAQVWASYEQKVMPASACEEQRRDMRDCFYTGASTVVDIMRMHMSPSGEITTEDEALMESLHAELEAFEREVVSRLVNEGKPGLG